MADSLAKEIGEIVSKELQKVLQPVEFPDEMKVEVINPPDPIKIDFTGLETAFKAFTNKKSETVTQPELKRIENLLDQILDAFQNTDSVDNVDVLNKILSSIQENKPTPVDFTHMVDELKSIGEQFTGMAEDMKTLKDKPTARGGGAIGPSKKFVMNKDGKTINPATSSDVLKATDSDGKTKKVGVEGRDKDALKTSDRFTYLLEEMLDELRLISLKLNSFNSDELTKDDLEDN